MDASDVPNIAQIVRNQQSIRVTMESMANEYPTAMAGGCKKQYFAFLRAWVDLLEIASPDVGARLPTPPTDGEE